jgi:hypothetical protein
MYPVAALRIHAFVVSVPLIYSVADVNFQAMSLTEVSYCHEVLVILYSQFSTGVIRFYGLPVCHVFVTALYIAPFCANSLPSRVAERHKLMATRLRDSRDVSPRSLNKFQGLYENNLTIPYNFSEVFSLCLPVLLCLQ